MSTDVTATSPAPAPPGKSGSAAAVELVQPAQDGSVGAQQAGDEHAQHGQDDGLDEQQRGRHEAARRRSAARAGNAVIDR